MELRREVASNEPISQEEISLMLRLHREQEVRGDGARASTLSDVADALEISDEEAARLLERARAKNVAKSKSRRKWPIVLAATLVVLLSIPLMRQNELVDAPADPTYLTEGVTPVDQPPTLPPGELAVQPPQGFVLTVVNEDRTTWLGPWEGPDAKFGTRWDLLTPAQSAQTRRQIIDAVVGFVKQSEIDGRSIELTVGVQQGTPVSVRVPLRPYTLPLSGNPKGEEALRGRLEEVLAARWSTILAGAPR